MTSPYLRHFSVTIFPVMPERSGRTASHASQNDTSTRQSEGVSAAPASDEALMDPVEATAGAETFSVSGWEIDAERTNRKTLPAICMRRTYFFFATQQPKAAASPGTRTSAASAYSAYVAFGSPKAEANGRE